MNQGRVIDHQVLKYKFKTYTETYMEQDECEYFEYLINIETSKGWTPQGDYYKKGHEFRQTMVKYEGFVTSNPPPPPRPQHPPKRFFTLRDRKKDKGVGPSKGGCLLYFCFFVFFVMAFGLFLLPHLL